MRHVALAILLLLAACSIDEGGQQRPLVLTAWAHAGQAAERDALLALVRRFNGSHDDVRVDLTLIPEGGYNAQVQAAAAAGDLPDLLEFDGPFLYNYVWQRHLLPLAALLPQELLDDLLPTIRLQGSYQGRLYALGQFDSGLGLWGRRSLLASVGARTPRHADEAWSNAEFNDILQGLSRRDADGAVIDLKLNLSGEWITYAFLPLLVSAGADLASRRQPWHASGVLDSPAAVAAMTEVQSWISRGWVDANVDDAAFTQGRVALAWGGHWDYPRYRKAWGSDLVLLPLPDFGHGSKTGMGSWQWGITRRCQKPQAAAAFLRFLLRPESVLTMTAANGAVPARLAARKRSPLYGAAGPLALFAEQLLGGHAVARPRTPAYPIITSAFQQAFTAIRNGADVYQALRRAAHMIDEDIRDNRGYP